MESSLCLSVRHQPISFCILLIRPFQEFLGILGKIILIDKIVASIVGWVDIDHLDLAEVGLLEQLQGIQIIALNKQVLGGVKIHALFPVGTQGLGNGCIGGK